jgi:hypothetical protein
MQFENPGDMKTAVETLPAILGQRLLLNVQWDPISKTFLNRTLKRR